MHAKVHSPCAGSPQKVLLSDSGIGKDVSTHWRRSKSIWIKELICYVLFVVSDNRGSVTDEVIEIAQSVDRFRGNISRADHAYAISAVVAGPVWCECCPTLCEHLERRLPAADDRVSPTRHPT